MLLDVLARLQVQHSACAKSLAIPAQRGKFTEHLLGRVAGGLLVLRSQLGDFIKDESSLSPMDSASFSMLKEELDTAMDSLTDRERKVIRLRFGLDDGKTRTLEEVGREFDVTRERIRQIEAKALRKLRHPSRSIKLKDFLLD